MADNTSQNFKNHLRFDPIYHFVTAPLTMAFLVWSIVHLYRHMGVESGAWLVAGLLFFLIVVRLRSYPLKVQDRVIRLEETLRLARLAPNFDVSKLREGQLVALRFASDAELPALAEKAASNNLGSKQIKESIQNWRGDYFRV